MLKSQTWQYNILFADVTFSLYFLPTCLKSYISVYWSTGPAVCFTIGAVALVVPLMFLCKVRFSEQKAD